MKYYLAHHGKQGQHWGVRHGPPYPLDSNASKQAKRKSASKSSYDKLYGDKKGSTRHTGSLLRDSNKTKEVSIIKRKDILENRLRNKSITRDEMIELTDINKVIRDLNTPRLDLSQKRSDTMNKEEIAKEQKRKRIKEGVAVTAGVIGLVTVAAKARKAYLESEKASLDLKKIKDGADAAKKVVESYSENKDTIKEGMKFAKEGVDAFTEAPASFSDVVKATSSAKNAVGDLVIEGIFRDISHSDLDGLYLAHHGVQNQHWGVRHGPPYPLDSNASKQAKRKSASKSSYDKLYGDKKGSSSHTGHTPGGLIYKNKKAKAAKLLDNELKNNRDFYKNTYKKDVQKETNALIKKTITPKILAATAAIPITISTGGSALPILLASYGGMALGSAGVGAIKAKRRGNNVRKAAVTNAAYALAPLPGGVLGYKAASNVRKRYIKKIADNI